MRHAFEVFVCKLPWQGAFLIVKEFGPTDIDPENGEIVKQDKDLAYDAQGIFNIGLLTLALLIFDTVHNLRYCEMQLVDLVDSDQF